MSEEPQPEVQKKVVYEHVTNSGTPKQNVPVIVGVVVAVVVIVYLIFARFS